MPRRNRSTRGQGSGTRPHDRGGSAHSAAKGKGLSKKIAEKKKWDSRVARSTSARLKIYFTKRAEK